MAQRGGGVGAVIAAAICGILAAIFGYMYYQSVDKINSLQTTLRTGSINDIGGADGWNNEKVMDVFVAGEKLKETIDELNQNLLDKDAEIADMKRNNDNLLDTINKSEQDLKEAENKLMLANSRVQQIEQELSDIRGKYDPSLETQLSNARQQLEKAQADSVEYSRKVVREGELRQELRKAMMNRIKELENENDGLRRVISNKMTVQQGRQSVKTDTYDGKIIEVDVKNKFVVINIGSAHRARQGMRFDVIRWRYNQWEYMGCIELTKIHPTVSEGVILDRIQRKKVCPDTGYVAKSPEEEISPFARRGVGQDKLVELVDAGMEEKPGMKDMDPIVVGDYIRNPFFNKDREMRFVVAGEKVHYSSAEIEERIRQYGGIIQQEVDVDTDYLVLGKVPDDTSAVLSDEVRKRLEHAKTARDTAQLYGIPIMREVELFDFLRQ